MDLKVGKNDDKTAKAALFKWGPVNTASCSAPLVLDNGDANKTCAIESSALTCGSTAPNPAAFTSSMQLQSDNNIRLILQADVLTAGKAGDNATVLFKASAWYSEWPTVISQCAISRPVLLALHYTFLLRNKNSDQT